MSSATKPFFRDFSLAYFALHALRILRSTYSKYTLLYYELQCLPLMESKVRLYYFKTDLPPNWEFVNDRQESFHS